MGKNVTAKCKEHVVKNLTANKVGSTVTDWLPPYLGYTGMCRWTRHGFPEQGIQF